MFLSAFAAAISAQQQPRATRPRVVAAPTTQSDSSTQNNAKHPPVLKGGNNSTGAPQQAPATVNFGAEVVEENEVIRVETSLVTIPVSVIDREGRFVTGLQKKDFKIFENGVEQKIDNFATVEQPFTVVLLLDVSPSTAYKIDEIRDAAISFVNQLRADDKVTVIAFDERVQILSPPTNNRAILRNAILQADFGNGTNLYDAVDYAINRQLKNIEGRKAVVLFTDGVDNISAHSTYQSTVQETQETDILFYPIRYDTFQDSDGGNAGNSTNNNQNRRRKNGGSWIDILGAIISGDDDDTTTDNNGNRKPRSNTASREEYETGRRYLDELARNSGGRMFEANRTNNLDAAFSGIAEELRRQYSLGYYPEAVGKIGERKQIKVRVMQPNLAVRAKTSYTVGEADKKFAGR